MKELKTISRAKPQVNNLILIVVFLTIFLLSLNNFLFIFILFIYSLYLFKKCKSLFFLSFCISVVLLLIFLFKEHRVVSDSLSVKGKVCEIEKGENYNKIVVKEGTYKVLLYDYNKFSVKVGDIISTVCEEKNVDTYFIEGDFDYVLYLKHKDILRTLNVKELNVIRNTFTIKSVRYFLIEYFDSHFSKDSSSFLKAVIIGESSELDINFKGTIKKMGISHLFAISGLHISIFSKALDAILRKMKIREKRIDQITSLLLLTYIIITNYSPSVIRASMMHVLSIVKRKKNMHLSACDKASCAFIIHILLNPYNMYKEGFVLSYLSSFAIMLTSPLIKKKSFIKETIASSCAITLLSLPLIVNMSNSLNLFTPIFNVVFIFLFSNCLFPLCMVLSFFPIFCPILDLAISGFKEMVEVVSSLDVRIHFASFSYVSIVIFLLAIYLILSRTKLKRIVGIATILLVLVYQYNPNVFNVETKIAFLDMYYGESTVIFPKLSRYVIIIDTGDGTNNALTNYLHYKGVKKIKYLIITHDHEDHNGEVENLKQEFKVETIVSSVFDSRTYGLDKKVIAGGTISYKDISFKIVSPYTPHKDKNDDSIVMLANISSLKTLFMGDASINIEKELDVGKVDILKVGHHGSMTASSLTFLEKVNPKYAIIMCTRKEVYDFPSPSVLSNFEKLGIKTYQTKTSKSITIHKLFNYTYLKCLAFTK